MKTEWDNEEHALCLEGALSVWWWQGKVFQEPSLEAAQQMRNFSAKIFSPFQDHWQWLELNIPCTILIQEGKMYFWWANLFLDTCFYLQHCPCRVSPKEKHGRGLFWYFVNGVVFDYSGCVWLWGKGKFRSQHALSGCVLGMPTAGPLYIAPLPQTVRSLGDS